MNDPSGYLQKFTSEEIVMRRPNELYLTTGLCAAVLGLIEVILLIGLVMTARHGVGKDPLGFWMFTGLALFLSAPLLFCLPMLGPFHMLGPFQLECNLRDRTYKWTRGYPFPSRTTSGPLSAFSAVAGRYVPQANGLGGASFDYRIYLVWKTAPRIWGLFPAPRLMLSMAKNATDAVAIMQTLGKALDLPVDKIGQ